MLPFTLVQLQTFVRAVELGSVTAVANELFVSQPAVTQQLRTMERHLGVELFAKTGRTVTLTNAGETLYKAASEALRLLKEACETVKQHAPSPYWRLRVGATPTWAFYRIPTFLELLHAQLPNLSVDLEIDYSSELCKKVHLGELDCAFVWGPIPDIRGMASLVVSQEELVFVARPGYVPLDRAAAGLELLLQRPLILPKEHGPTLSLLRGDLGRLIARHRQVYHLQPFEVAKRAAEAGLGIGLIPKIALQEEAQDGRLEVLPVPPKPLHLPQVLVYPRGRRASASMKAFVALARRINETWGALAPHDSLPAALERPDAAC